MATSGTSNPESEKPEAGALKRKLDALGYTNADERSDTPLVRQIVDDLIHTTDCYLALKQQASSGIQHVNHLTDKVEVLTRDTERLATENNHLHLQIIQEAEKHGQFEREHLRKHKSLEDAVAELTFLKGSGAAKRAALAEENAGLRAKMRELLNELEAYQQAGSDGEGMPQRPRHLDLAQPLIQRIAAMPMNSALAENVDILRATECRVASLEAAVKERESQLHSARQDVEQLQEAVKAREREVLRLGQEAGKSRNLDALAFQQRCEGQEALILQLTDQVDRQKAAIAEAEVEAARREDVTSQLAHSERARLELEFKLKDALRGNTAASREVKTMRASLKSLQLNKLRHASHGSRQPSTLEISETTTRALELAEQRLAEAAAELQRRSVVLQDVSAERDTALAKVALLESQLQNTTAERTARQEGNTTADTAEGKALPLLTDAKQLEDQMKFLSDERAVLAEDVSRTTARVEHLEQQLLQAAMDSKRLEGELADAKTHINSLNSDREKAVERQKALEAEASLLRQAFSRRAGGAEDAYAERCRQAEQLLAQQLGACNRITEELMQAKQQLDAATRGASALEAQCSSLQQELHASREAHDVAAGSVHTLQHELHQAHMLSEHRSREVAQLREVSAQADHALQQCLAQLQALKADAEAKEGVLERDAATQQCLQAELDRVKKVYEHERELVKTHQEDKASWMSKARIKEQELKNAMQREKVLQEAAASARSQAQDASQHQQELAQENAALRHEIQAIAEDLEALVKENQMIGHQLVAVTAKRERWQGDMSASAEHAQRAETLARCRESEATQLRREYEALLAKHRHMESNYAALQHDLACCQGELAANKDDITVLKDAHSAAEAQVTQQSQDIQVWEQQVASLSSQLVKVTADMEDAGRERQTLLDSLRASEQAKCRLEQQCQQLQRRAAALSGKVHSLEGRCEDAEADAHALQHRLGLEAERVADLELLLGGLRASQFHLQGSAQRSTGPHPAMLVGSEDNAKALARVSRKAASLEADLASAEAKIHAVQARVRELHTENTSLGASLSAARAERNALSAAVRASTSESHGIVRRSDHSDSTSTLALARADAAQSKEENTRLLDLLSRVDAERAALEKSNWALRAGDAFTETVDQESGISPEVEAARLALELAQEKSQRQKAENDFEELLENLERQARHPDSPLGKSAATTMELTPPRSTSSGDTTPRRTHSSGTAAAEGLTTALSSEDGSRTQCMPSSSASRRLSTPSAPSGPLAAYVSQLSALSSHGYSYAASSQASLPSVASSH